MLPVTGKVQFFKIFGFPSRALCSIVITTFVVGEDTRSMAPPMPFTIIPGIIQLAKSPFSDTCMPPRIVRSMCPL